MHPASYVFGSGGGRSFQHLRSISTYLAVILGFINQTGGIYAAREVVNLNDILILIRLE